ncbi:hypothetical protein BGY98DRAFT_1044279 [Russula aff. rugulosa BPL654]|nr:hypothetical protein BGY98DRAFT_1044279 [Russula aff. rugulosa BPL654]
MIPSLVFPLLHAFCSRLGSFVYPISTPLDPARSSPLTTKVSPPYIEHHSTSTSMAARNFVHMLGRRRINFGIV